MQDLFSLENCYHLANGFEFVLLGLVCHTYLLGIDES